MPRNRYTQEEFDSLLAVKNPNVVRISNYVTAKTKIEFKCLKHKEIHQSAPYRCLEGKGLACCRSSRISSLKAALKFDLKLSKVNPLIKRVDEYVHSKTKIRFKCLKHNEIHKAQPSHCLGGSGLKCCSSKLGSSLRDNLRIEDNNQTIFYTCSLSRYKKYVKFGIAKNLQSRKDSEYGEEVFTKQFHTRLEAFVIEQACLKDSQLVKDCPEELHLNKWRGRTEVRKCSKEMALARVNFYVQKLESMGVKEFILKYLNPSPYEKALLKRKSL